MRHFFSITSPLALISAAALISFAAVGCSSAPTSRTVANSDTTTQTSAGGETRTTVRETTTQGANGANTSERTETVRTSTPAPTPARQ